MTTNGLDPTRFGWKDRTGQLDAGELHRQSVQNHRQVRSATPGIKSPALWGNKAHLDALFGAKATIAVQSKSFVFRYKSPKHWVEIFRNYYGPVVKAFAAIDPKAREALEADLYALLDKFNAAKDGTIVVPSEYLEVVITKRR
jgi:hypothetical protein